MVAPYLVTSDEASGGVSFGFLEVLHRVSIPPEPEVETPMPEI